MPVPKKRLSRCRRDKRRSHHRLKHPTYVECSNCHEMKLPHCVCHNCGFYKGRQIVTPRKA